MRLITFDDIIDVYTEIKQRSFSFILSKFSFSGKKRTRATFDSSATITADYWIIPGIRERWNLMITGEKSMSYEDYVVKKYFDGRSGLKMLSLGSGIASHEMAFARHDCFSLVKCIDFSENKLRRAEHMAREEGLANMVFEPADINHYHFSRGAWDMVLFHSSLHHLRNVDQLIPGVKNSLKQGGYLIINEYTGPNRLQVSKSRIRLTNRILREYIPAKFRTRYNTRLVKNRVSGPGILRVMLSDPSEAVESEKILPSIHANFDIVEEKKIGGDILMYLFKDIAHHFLESSEEKQTILGKVFLMEDKFIGEHGSDFIFGVYRKD